MLIHIKLCSTDTCSTVFMIAITCNNSRNQWSWKGMGDLEKGCWQDTNLQMWIGNCGKGRTLICRVEMEGSTEVDVWKEG